MIERKNLLLGICGSPRRQGTEYAIKYALNYATEKFGFETEYWTVRNKEINFCLHCDYCVREKKGCVNKDDMEKLYPKLEQA
ncbi:unnamed protein product, partial [marine sediment metagenome]